MLSPAVTLRFACITERLTWSSFVANIFLVTPLTSKKKKTQLLFCCYWQINYIFEIHNQNALALAKHRSALLECSDTILHEVAIRESLCWVCATDTQGHLCWVSNRNTVTEIQAWDYCLFLFSSLRYHLKMLGGTMCVNNVNWYTFFFPFFFFLINTQLMGSFPPNVCT